MDEPRYSFRASLAGKETGYRLTADGIAWPGGGIAFADVKELRLYGVPGATLVGAGQAVAPHARCVVRPRRGRALVLQSRHFRGLGRFEDRSAAFGPFVHALVGRLAAANPGAALRTGMPAALWWTWFALMLLSAAVCLLALTMLAALAIDGRLVSFDALTALVFAFGTGLSAVSTARVLAAGRSRPLAAPQPAAAK